MRIYPSCCTSAFCGKSSKSCPSCRHWPTLREFMEWVERTGAVVTDPIWCPTAYTIPGGVK